MRFKWYLRQRQAERILETRLINFWRSIGKGRPIWASEDVVGVDPLTEAFWANHTEVYDPDKPRMGIAYWIGK